MQNLETEYLIIGVVIFLIFLFIMMYNSLIRKRNNCEQSWSGIAVQLKRRHNLIPNLVSAIKGYVKHEQGTFTKITKLSISI